MGSPLQVFALVARTLSLLHNIPLIGVNHCVARSCLSPPLVLLALLTLTLRPLSY